MKNSVAVLKVEDLLKELNRFGVEFIIIGGMAAVAQGSAYLTMDLDLCYSRSKENIDRLADALASFQPSLRGAPPDLPFRLDAAAIRSGMNFTLSTNFGDLDILGEVTGLSGYSEALLLSEMVELYGMRCRILTLEGLIKTKKAAGRPKDLMILPELEALLELRRTQNKS